MKKFFLFLLTVMFPWAMMFVYDNPGGALVCLFLQATIIGWPFAAMWTWKVVKAGGKPEKEASKDKQE